MKDKRFGRFVLLTIIGIGALMTTPLGFATGNTRYSQLDRSDLAEEQPLSSRTVVHLYFADQRLSFLRAEMRFIVPSRDPVLLARFIFEELVKGPEGALAATLPPRSAMRAIFIADGSVCYLDLTDAIRETHPGGIQSELFSIYSIVNSLVLNIPQIDAVKFLIEGNEVQTLAGHIDLQLPVKANMLLIR